MTRKYRVEITKVAESDIREIYAYISQDSPKAATAWVEEIERQIGQLESFPLRCSTIPEAHDPETACRQLIYGNYRTIIKIDKDLVTIMRVIHSGRLLDLGIFQA